MRRFEYGSTRIRNTVITKAFFVEEFGGDPVTASVVTDKGALIPTRLTDLGDGTYEIRNVAKFS